MRLRTAVSACVAGLGTAVALLATLQSCRDVASPTRETPAIGHGASVASAPPRTGHWSAPFAWPNVAVHLHVLPSGKVLSWGHAVGPHLWTPATGTQVSVPAPSLEFCSGHAFLPDGRLLVTGGHYQDNLGLANVNLFDFATERWTAAAPMANGRWYPTTTALPSGDVLTLSGSDIRGRTVQDPEIWRNGTWRALTGARLALIYYPRAFVAPNGMLFYAGEGQPSRYLDLTGNGAWSTVGNRVVADRSYGSAVMYAPGKIIYIGGGNPPTNTAEIIDLNQGAPTWQATTPMEHARRQMNATLLADATVLAIGGTSHAGWSWESGAVYPAEIWNPTTEQWTTVASNTVVRVYHSTAVLLPDGRVLVAGSGDALGLTDRYSAELYSPGYLFNADNVTKATRPRISSAPTRISYAQPFVVSTPDAATITAVNLIRLGSATHAFDQSQRVNALAFTPVADGLRVTPPANGNLAPPGYYMLFIVNATGVPSVAAIVRIG